MSGESVLIEEQFLIPHSSFLIAKSRLEFSRKTSKKTANLSYKIMKFWILPLEKALGLIFFYEICPCFFSHGPYNQAKPADKHSIQPPQYEENPTPDCRHPRAAPRLCR